MHGKIKFETVEQLAIFLKEFVPSTAIFEVNVNEDGVAVLHFTGGC